MLGKKNENIETILLMEAKSPQNNIKIFDVNGTNTFSVPMDFKSRVKQLFKETKMDRIRIAMGFIGNPMNVS